MSWTSCGRTSSTFFQELADRIQRYLREQMPVWKTRFPGVETMQVAVMDKMQQQMMSNIEKVSPEALMQSWFTFDPKIAERFQEMFVNLAGLGARRDSDKK